MNFGLRLDEILDGIDKAIETRVMREPLSEDAWLVGMRLELKEAVTDEAKQAITSLIKELATEARIDELEEIRTRQGSLCSISGVMYLKERIDELKKEVKNVAVVRKWSDTQAAVRKQL